MTTKAKKPKKPAAIYAPLPCGAIVLSLDISSSVTGWAVGEIQGDGSVDVIDFGAVAPSKSWVSTKRIEWMWGHVLGLIKDHKVTRGCCEWQSHRSTSQRVQGLAVLGQAQGFLYAKASAYFYIDRISERDWTKVGGKNASKKVRCELVKAAVPRYATKASSSPDYDPGLDIADAIGLLLWRANQ